MLSQLSCLMVAGVLGVANVKSLSAQELPSSPELTFEAASIRPSNFEPGCFSMLPPGGKQYAVSCITLRDLIALAWKLNPGNIEGGDAHSLAVFYDLKATVPEGQQWTQETLPTRLRQLLVERFHLQVHRGTKQISGYGLIVSKGGAKLIPPNADTAQLGVKAGEAFQNYIIPGGVQGRGVSLAVIASLLSSPAHATVIDHTGIQGIFNVDLHYASDGANQSDLPDFFTSVEEQLGLKLRPEKVTVDTLVIDHADGGPTSN